MKIVPLMAFAGIDAVQPASAPVAFLIVIGLLTPAEAVAPQGMALNTIEVGVTVIGSAVVAVPFMVVLATGNSSGASLSRRMTMGQLARLPVAHASAGF